MCCHFLFRFLVSILPSEEESLFSKIIFHLLLENMDNLKQRLKMKSFSIFYMSTLLFLLINVPVIYATSNTFVIGEIECVCSNASAVCIGSTEEPEEIKDVLSNLLQNCSSINNLLDLTLNIKADSDNWPAISFNNFQLQNLTLGFNLGILYEESFYGLNSTLSSLILSHNDIEFMFSKHSPFSILENLKVLNLDFNNFEKFDDSIFENLTKLEVLSIAGNTFTDLQANLLENMTEIRTLILDHNKNFFSLSNLNLISSTLLNLSAKNCSINGSLDTNSLSGISNLKSADFSSNNLAQVDTFALETLHNLETLNLSYNKIETLKNYSFSAFYNLEVLDLKDNDISVIEEFAFVNLTHLKILNLANNKLYGFLKNYALDLYSLETINLVNNDIHYVESDSFSKCIQLRELLLQGNAFGCWHCDTMYIVSLLTNNTLFKKEDADAITCAEPKEMKDMLVAEVTLEKLEDYCDPMDFTSEEPDTTEEIIATSDIFLTSTDEVSNTDTSTTAVTSTSITSQSTSESTDTTIQSTTLTIASTTKTSSLMMSDPTDAATEIVTLISESTSESFTTGLSSVQTEEISTHTTTEVVTLSIPTAKATTQSTSTTTEDITMPISEYTTTGNVTTSESTTLSITTTPNTTIPITEFVSISALNVSTTEEVTISETFSTTLTNVTTEPPTISIDRKETSQFSTPSTKVDFGSTDILDYSEITTTPLPTKKIPNSQIIHIADYTVSNETICVRWNVKWEVLNKQWNITELKCGVEIQHSTGKELRYFKNCPTSDNEMLECTNIDKKYLGNMYKFCLNVYISIYKKMRSCSKYDSPATTEKSFKHLTSREPSTLKSSSPTKIPFVPFKVVKFDAIFNHTKSFLEVSWVVNRNERYSICILNLILMSHNFNYTEGVFACKNNSYKIQNIKHESFQVCLRNFYQGHYAPLMCKSSVPVPYKFSAASMKDEGFKNSALIAVICLLILIVLIVIVILLKKILKKRHESDLYNVSAEEKNILRRQTSTAMHQEPCVRYSYTLREQMEI